MTTDAQFANGIAKSTPKKKPQGSTTNGLAKRTPAELANPGFANPYAGTTYGAHSAGNNPTPAHPTGGNALYRFLDAIGKAKAPTVDPADASVQAGASFDDGLGSTLGALHKGFDDQIAAIHEEHDRQQGHLDSLHGSADAGVVQGGAELQARLRALGLDARDRNAKSTNAIKGDYVGARHENNALLQSLAHDAAGQGAGTDGIRAETRALASHLAAGQANDTAVSSRYGQILGQALNDRQAEGHASQRGSLNEMARTLLDAKYTSDQSQTDAISKLRAAMAANEASAQQTAAGLRAKHQDALVKAGAAGAPTLSEAESLAGKYAPDYGGGMLNSMLKSKNPKEVQWANAQLNDLAKGLKPSELMARFNDLVGRQGKAIGFKHSTAAAALGDAHRINTAAEANEKQFRQLLGS